MGKAKVTMTISGYLILPMLAILVARPVATTTGATAGTTAAPVGTTAVCDTEECQGLGFPLCESCCSSTCAPGRCIGCYEDCLERWDCFPNTTTTEASITTSGGKEIANSINFLLLSFCIFAADL